MLCWGGDGTASTEGRAGLWGWGRRGWEGSRPRKCSTRPGCGSSAADPALEKALLTALFLPDWKHLIAQSLTRSAPCSLNFPSPCSFHLLADQPPASGWLMSSWPGLCPCSSPLPALGPDLHVQPQPSPGPQSAPNLREEGF